MALNYVGLKGMYFDQLCLDSMSAKKQWVGTQKEESKNRDVVVDDFLNKFQSLLVKSSKSLEKIGTFKIDDNKELLNIEQKFDLELFDDVES